MHVFGKTLCYCLERVTGNLHSKFGPILTNTDRVLQSYAVYELKYAVNVLWNVILRHLFIPARPFDKRHAVSVSA